MVWLKALFSCWQLYGRFSVHFSELVLFTQDKSWKQDCWVLRKGVFKDSRKMVTIYIPISYFLTPVPVLGVIIESDYLFGTGSGLLGLIWPLTKCSVQPPPQPPTLTLTSFSSPSRHTCSRLWPLVSWTQLKCEFLGTHSASTHLPQDELLAVIFGSTRINSSSSFPWRWTPQRSSSSYRLWKNSRLRRPACYWVLLLSY